MRYQQRTGEGRDFDGAFATGWPGYANTPLPNAITSAALK